MVTGFYAKISQMKKAWLLYTTVFVAAFLLFQIELIISKILLPQFGGSYAVWGAALVFFQATLLLGYLYSHIVVKKIGMRRYRYFHFGLLSLTLFFFPGKPLPAIYPLYQIPIVVNIFGQLLTSIGLAFFTLSTLSIIFQSWLSQSDLAGSANPYKLYAVSNLGSFMGLLSYPVFFEIYFDLNTQLNIWRILYFIVFGLQILIFKLIKVSDEAESAGQDSHKISFNLKLKWFLLSMAGVIMFLSVTNILTFDVTPIPMLWILPLCIYLISFVLNFKNKPWRPSKIKDKFYIAVTFGLLFYFLLQKMVIPVIIEFLSQLIILFIVCMFCQNQLSESKPADSRNLTYFYLIISIGGFLGSLLVSWILPLISNTMVEYLAGLFIILLVLVINEKRLEFDLYRVRLLIYVAVFILLWPIAFREFNVLGIILIAVIFKFTFSEFKNPALERALGMTALLCMFFYIEVIWPSNAYVYKRRNYYSIYKVYDKAGKRILVSGTTEHGAQYLIGQKQMEPLTYYHVSTPVGKVLVSKSFNFRRVGIIGLGSGALAAYGKKGQQFDFFELDPDVLFIANKYFTYLKNSPGQLRCMLGDARLSLRMAPDNYYDLLIVDAFNGDSVPVHLLTTEAIKEYLRATSKGGLILFHISNRHIDFGPILAGNSKALELYSCGNYNEQSQNRDAYYSVWLALTKDADVFEKLTAELKWHPPDAGRNVRPWTDQYSNVSSALKIKEIVSEITRFKTVLKLSSRKQ